MSTDQIAPPGPPPPPKRGRGAPKGNTNAVKHGRNSRVRGPALALMRMIQREHPDWIADPRQVPEPIAALFITLGERLLAVEETARQRRERKPFPAIPMGLLQDAADLQARLPQLGYNFPPFESDPLSLSAGGEGHPKEGERFDAEQQTTNN